MNRLVLGVFMIGATLLLLSLGIMMIGASLLLFIISHFAFPNLRKFVPDINAFTGMLRWALQGLLFDSIYEDEFKRGDDIQDESLDKWSDTTYLRKRKVHEVQETIIPRPREEHRYTEPYHYEPHPQNQEKPKTYHCAPRPKESENHEPFHYEPRPNYEADIPIEPKKPEPYHYLDYLPYHCEPFNNGPHPKNPSYGVENLKHPERPIVVERPHPERPIVVEKPPPPEKAAPPPPRKPNEFVNTYNKIKTFGVTDQTGDSD